MTPDQWVVIGILVVAVVLFITEWIRVDVVALGVVVSLMLAGILSTDEAFSGFSNAAVLTIASLFIVGGAVLQTGLAGMIGRRLLTVAGDDEVRLTVVLMTAVALLSGFMSDTGTVAVLLPAIVILARSASISPSKLLIPLSFGALLGGATTLIGTPPNLIVSDLLHEEGLAPFTFFSFTPMGLVLIVTGILFMMLVGRRLLPDRRPRVESQPVETPEELMDLYRLPENLFRLRVRRGSELVGQTLADARLREQFEVNVLEILRREEPRPSLRLVGQRELRLGTAAERAAVNPEADTQIQVDDLLIVQGSTNDVTHAAAVWNLAVQPAQAEDEEALITQEVGIAEVVIPPRSAVAGKTLVELRFGRVYGLTVLAIDRPGVKGPLDLKETELQFGDILVVQGPWERILALKQRRRDFVVMGQPETMIGAPRRGKATVALVVLAGMLALMITNLIPVSTASMLAALGMVLTGCLTMDEAYEAVDWRSVVLIAGMIPMSLALEKVALVDLAAQVLVGKLGSLGPLAVMAGLFLLTSAFTQVLSNTATTVVVAPIALAAARTLGVQPYAFLMAVAVAASMAFASPVASPVNTLVMGAGDYRFGDYVKVGVPMILLTLVAAILVLPLLFPF